MHFLKAMLYLTRSSAASQNNKHLNEIAPQNQTLFVACVNEPLVFTVLMNGAMTLSRMTFSITPSSTTLSITINKMRHSA